MKLFLSELLHFFSQFKGKNEKLHNEAIVSALSNDGIYIQENYITPSFAQELKEEVHEKITINKDDVQVYDGGADSRLFQLEKYSDKFKFFIQNETFDYYRDYIQGYSCPSKLIMANILKPLEDNLGSGGGWHRDSPFRNQFKAFLFLSDVSIDNGPITYIPKTHTSRNIRQVSKLLGSNKSQYRFDNEQVEKVIQELNLKPASVTCPAGTMVMANVRGLHRGAPIISGERVALTNYYLTGSIPSNFGKQNLSEHYGK